MLQDFPLYAYIPAKDLARARRFYEDKLGFRPGYDVPVGEYRWLTVGDDHSDVQLLLEPDAHPAAKAFKAALVADGVVYEFSDKTACFLYPTPNAGTSRASQAFWQVDDVEREVAELKSRGVELENYDMPGEKSPSGVVEAGGAKAAWFKDSEGNILAIVQDA